MAAKKSYPFEESLAKLEGLVEKMESGDLTLEDSLKTFEEVLDKIVPKYGRPIIGLAGSGEATMAKDLAEYVKAVKSRGLVAFMYCNCAILNGKFMNDIIEFLNKNPEIGKLNKINN